MSKKYIIANWKALPETWGEAQQILDSLSDYFASSNLKELSVVICPPFNFIEEVGKILNTTSLGNYIELGAQDMKSANRTRYVIIGHSDRRWKLGESDKIVNQKLKTALENDLIPIVCVGERNRDENYKKFLEEQVKATFEGLSADEVNKCIIAYEPVWAISSNLGAHPDTPESALESIKIIENTLIGNLKLEIGNLPKALYGGSVNSSNVMDFICQDEIDGVLVGSASIDKEEFLKILSKLNK